MENTNGYLSPEYCNWYLASVISGKDIDSDLLGSMPEPYSKIIDKVIISKGGSRGIAFEEAIQGEPNAEEIRQRVFALSPDDEPPPKYVVRPGTKESDPLDIGSDIPPLPQSLRMIPIGKSEQLDRYLSHATAISPMTPKHFHTGVFLWLVAVIIARRLCLRMPFGEVFPNLFIVLIATTTLFRKTTSLAIARYIAKRLVSHLLAPQDSTPEALLWDMSGNEPVAINRLATDEVERWKKERDFAAQRGLTLDEISGLLASAGKDYNAGLIETFLRLYDCDDQFTRSTRTYGRVVVSKAYFSILGASTPWGMATHLSAQRLWDIGWWPRFAILTPSVTRPEWKRAVEVEEPTDLLSELIRLRDRLPIATWPDYPEALNVVFGHKVVELWEEYNKIMSYDFLTQNLDQRLYGTYGRLPTQVLKVATLLAALDWRPASRVPVIEDFHLGLAISICEEWRASVHRALVMCQQTAIDALCSRILTQVDKHEPKGITLRDLSKAIKSAKVHDLESALSNLIKIEEVEIDPSTASPKGGRPTVRYRRPRIT